jgi:plastocyanin
MNNTMKRGRKAAWVTFPVAIAAGLLIVGCGTTPTSSSSSSSTPPSTSTAAKCTPNGTSLTISAHDIKFDKSCMAAPAGKPFTITFENKDSGVPHDVAIYTNSAATKSLFIGTIITGVKTIVYHVPALKKGTYWFRCNVHPTVMHGTFVVG